MTKISLCLSFTVNCVYAKVSNYFMPVAPLEVVLVGLCALNPKLKKIVNFIVAQTDCGVFVITAILNLSLNISKLGVIYDSSPVFCTFIYFFFYLIRSYESKII